MCMSCQIFVSFVLWNMHAEWWLAEQGQNGAVLLAPGVFLQG